MKQPRTVAIIQARMGSTRLPGKVMMKIAGRPLLVYLVERISRSRTLDAIVVATTTNPRDNVIIEECERRGIPNFRGAESDVLGRYVSAARACEADIVVRVTADNPFTDPDSIDRVVDTLKGGNVDYAIENHLPVGVRGEALTWEALSFMDSVANTPLWREHVTLYAIQNPKALTCALLSAPPEYSRPDLSFTVGTIDEYLYNRELAERFSTVDFELKNLIEAADESMSGTAPPVNVRRATA
ncbi:MAG TPA: glycosyltransferase family protein [Terriglobia bacterium]|jgi:spore coat polysaccharide biosynthesis protein SpsF